MGGVVGGEVFSLVVVVCGLSVFTCVVVVPSADVSWLFPVVEVVPVEPLAVLFPVVPPDLVVVPPGVLDAPLPPQPVNSRTAAVNRHSNFPGMPIHADRPGHLAACFLFIVISPLCVRLRCTLCTPKPYKGPSGIFRSFCFVFCQSSFFNYSFSQHLYHSRVIIEMCNKFFILLI